MKKYYKILIIILILIMIGKVAYDYTKIQDRKFAREIEAVIKIKYGEDLKMTKLVRIKNFHEDSWYFYFKGDKYPNLDIKSDFLFEKNPEEIRLNIEDLEFGNEAQEYFTNKYHSNFKVLLLEKDGYYPYDFVFKCDDYPDRVIDGYSYRREVEDIKLMYLPEDLNN